MLTYWRGAFVVSLSALSLGACQVLSGLSGLEAEASGGPGVGAGGAGGDDNAISVGPGSTTSSSAAGVGGGGGATPCDVNPTSCLDTLTSNTGV
jgi:hypothetical protein